MLYCIMSSGVDRQGQV